MGMIVDGGNALNFGHDLRIDLGVALRSPLTGNGEERRSNGHQRQVRSESHAPAFYGIRYTITIMVTKQTLDTHLAYTVWATNHLISAVGKIPVDELMFDFKTGDRHIVGTLAHVFA